MDITKKNIWWVVCGTDFVGEIDYFESFHTPLLNTVYNKISSYTGLNDLSLTKTVGNYFIAISKSIFNKSNKHETDTYCALNVTKHSGDILARKHTTKEICCIALLVKRFNDNVMIIKLLKPIQANWRRGPTCPSKYLFIDKKNKCVESIYIGKQTYDEFETKVKNNEIIMPDSLSESEFKYTSIDHAICAICLVNEVNIHIHCPSQHGVVCSGCATLIDKCPICDKKIKAVSNLIYL